MTTAPDAEVLDTIGATDHAVRKRRVKIAAIVVASMALVAAGLFAYRRAVTPTPVAYQTRAVERGDLTVAIVATGTLEPTTEVEVGPEISGRVAEVHADFNDHVEQGEVLVTLDDESLRASVSQAEAQLRAARAALRTAQATEREASSRLARARALPGASGLAAQEVEALAAAAERADAGVESARAEVAVANAALSAARENVRRATIRSPITGVVLSRSVEPGQTLAAAFTTPVLFVLAESLDRMELHVDVDEADIGEVREGEHATFTVDAFPERTFEATVVSVRNTPRTVQNVVTYEAVLTADNEAHLLRPGMTATARIVADTREDVLLVPNAALRFRPVGAEDDARARTAEPEPTDRDTPSTDGASSADGARAHRVFVLEDGEPTPKPVTLGPTDGRRTVVSSGLDAGDEVIVDLARAPSPPAERGARHP